jgi:hypothetical protein
MIPALTSCELRDRPQAVGLPEGMNIWLDLEGIAEVASSFDVIASCNAWFAEVSAAGYVPGLYVGANAILDGEELYYALSVEHYWRSGSEVPDVEVRGYCMVETIDDAYEIDGCAYDQDITQADNLGNTPMWLINPLAQPVVSSDGEVASATRRASRGRGQVEGR